MPPRPGGRCFKDGLGGGLGGLGGCKTSIKRKWASDPGGAGGEVKWKRKRWEEGRKERERGKLIFKRVFSDAPTGCFKGRN